MNTIIEDTARELKCENYQVFTQAVTLHYMRTKSFGSRCRDARNEALRQHAKWLNNRTVSQELEDFCLSILREVPKYKEKKHVVKSAS